MNIITRTLLGFSVLLIACKESQKEQPNSVETIEETTEITEIKLDKSYPEGMNKVFDAHGTYALWNDMKSLTFTLDKDPSETHQIDLKSRKVRINSSDYTIGYDGKDVWIDKEGKYPADRARFYHNLYFYFYAMPFILGDDGINYTEVPNLIVEGKEYPGYKISYEANVGDSPDDNYFIYMNPETNRMEWLGYTVTYGKDGPSNDISFIKYTDWEQINGLLLPKKLAWYKAEKGVPITKLNHEAMFSNVSIVKDVLDKSLFIKPEDAVIGSK